MFLAMEAQLDSPNDRDRWPIIFGGRSLYTVTLNLAFKKLYPLVN
jgi:hypothetical protein